MLPSDFNRLQAMNSTKLFLKECLPIDNAIPKNGIQRFFEYDMFAHIEA